jgi:CubicO group peptidase (beta-lactamase class C family)
LGCRLAYSRYFNHDVASVTKSITSLLVGVAIEQGYLKGVDEKVLPYFPEYLPLSVADERKENITIEDLLTMQTGMECDDWDPASRTYYQKNQPDQTDDIGFILNFPMETTPGSSFAYCTSGAAVLNALLIKVTGMELPAFADRYLFQPLGMKGVVWDISSGGWKNIDGISGMYPREMARLGLLLLQNGKWQGEQPIPQTWIEQSTREHVALAFNTTWGKGYGYLWWLSDVPIAGKMVHSFAASGHGVQVIAVFPELNMVVVFTGSNYDNDVGQPFEIMERFILPAVLAHSGKPAPAVIAATATPATGISAYTFPETIDPAGQYLFYLHGKIIEDQGIPAVSEEFGEYEYEAILAS